MNTRIPFQPRPMAELEAQAARVHAEASAEAAFHDLGCIVLCFTADGAFRIVGAANVTFSVGLLQRAATELHLFRRDECSPPPVTARVEAPRHADGLLLWGSDPREPKGGGW